MENILKKSSYGLMALIIALPVMFRGLFFEYDFAVFACVALGILAFMAFFAKNIKVSLVTDSGLIVFTLLYGLTALFAVNKGYAVPEFLKYLAILVIYFGVKATARENDGKTTVMLAVVLAAGISSIISLFTAAGVFNYPAAYSTSEIEKWLNGTLQYHNAFGALMVCALFVSCALNRSTSKIISTISGGMGYFIAFGMLMSYSRGAWVTAPIAFIVYMIFADKEARLSFFEIAASGVIASVAVLPKFTGYVESANKISAVLWLMAGLVIYAVLYLIVKIVFKALKDKKHFDKAAVIVVAAVVVLAVLVVSMPNVFSAILPGQLADRLSGISFGAETAKERFVFYKDALDIAKKSPVFGSGGGAWQDLYGMSQSYYYSSTQAHSFVMQVLVETGVAGLVAWLVTLIIFYVKAVKLLIKKAADRKILAGIVSGATVLIAHSFIDFDLSISAVLIILIALIAALFAFETQQKEYSINKYVCVVLCVVLIIPFAMSASAADAYQKGVEAFNQKKYPLAYECFEKSSSLKPYDPMSLSYKAASQSYIIKHTQQRLEVVENIEKAEKAAPNSIIVNQNAITTYSNIGAYEVALQNARKIITLQPMNINNYISYLVSAHEVVKYYYSGVNPSAAKAISDDVLTLNEFVEELNSKRVEKIEFSNDIKEMLMYFMVVSYNVK